MGRLELKKTLFMALIVSSLLGVWCGPALAMNQPVKGTPCRLWFAGVGRCYSTVQRSSAESSLNFPIDPSGAVVWHRAHLRPTGEVIIRYRKAGPVDGIYYTYGQVPSGHTTSRYLVVGETIHTASLSPDGKAPAGAAESWEVNAVLPNTHVRLTLLGNLSHTMMRMIAARILALAPKRMTVNVRGGFSSYVEYPEPLWRPWGIHPTVLRARAIQIARSAVSKLARLRGAVLARVIDTENGDSNSVDWVVVFSENCGQGAKGGAFVFVLATTGQADESGGFCNG